MTGAFPLPYPVLTRAIRDLLPLDRKLYLVGGAVRDTLLGRTTHDVDLIALGDIRQLARRVADRIGGAFYMLDDERSTARIICPQEERLPGTIDIALMRSDSIEGDLRLRDFTINAMAVDLDMPDILIDPTGGARDLVSSKLSPCSSASFMDDPLRILRSVRMAHEFQLEFGEDLFPLINQALPGLGNVSAERVRDELFRILDGGHVTMGVRLMARLGVFEAVLPEVDAIRQPAGGEKGANEKWAQTLSTLRCLELLCTSIRNGKLTGPGAKDHYMVEAWKMLKRYDQRMVDYLESAFSGNRTRKSLLFLGCLYMEIVRESSVQADERAPDRSRRARKENRSLRRRTRALALSMDEMEFLDRLTLHAVGLQHLSETGEAPGRKEIYQYFRLTGDAGVGTCLLSLAGLRATPEHDLSFEKWGAVTTIVDRMMDAWWNEQRMIVDPPRVVSGDELQEIFGLPPGPRIGALLEAIREAQAHGGVTNRNEAITFAGDWLHDRI